MLGPTFSLVTPRGRPAFIRAASLLGLWALGGCAVGPRYARPEVSVAEAWRERDDPSVAASAAVEATWWREFGDATLDQLVELTRRQNLPLQIAGLRIMEARAQLGIATGLQYPQVQAAFGSLSAVGLSKDAANVPGADRRFADYQVGLQAAWEIDFWGKYRRGVEAQAANALATVADYYAALVSLTAQVAQTYVAVRTFEVHIQQARENAAIQEQGLAIARSRFKNGATSELDVAQATTLLESTRATIPALEIGLQQARNALSTLLGQPPGTVDALLDGPRGIPKAPATVGVGVPAELLRRRPDIRSAELFAAAQCARIGVAKADLYPSFVLFGTLGVQASSSGGTWANPFKAEDLFYAVGPRINWPFFNYGRIENAVRVEDARFQELLVSYRDTVIRAAQEVEDAMIGFVKSQEAVVLQERAVVAARRAVDLALVQYREGATDYQRVLDAQRTLLQQQDLLTQSASSVASDVIALYRALGGGWDLGQDQPPVPVQMQEEMKKRTNWGDMLSEPSGPERKAPAPPEKH